MRPKTRDWFGERPPMKKHTALLYTLVGLALVVLNSCAGTKLTYVWKDPRYGGGYLTSVMVVGVSEELARRRLFEEVFARELEKRGIKTVASIKVLGPDTRLTRDAVKAEADRLGVDAVLATRLLSAGKEETYQPPSTSVTPGSSARTIDLYFYAIGGHSHSPGRYSKHFMVRLETNVFDTGSEKLVWTAASTTINPESVREIIDALCAQVMERLKEDRLIR